MHSGELSGLGCHGTGVSVCKSNLLSTKSKVEREKFELETGRVGKIEKDFELEIKWLCQESLINGGG